ncbi:MAG: hypothetical protein CM15mV142_460 [Caudoviricetes sp.]|nr:MAG: hypothetical protein CM15mV142_460 [Caudoviricetes sp.]
MHLRDGKLMEILGHLLPEVAGAVDIGSTSAEIGNVLKIADDKKFLGKKKDKIKFIKFCFGF